MEIVSGRVIFRVYTLSRAMKIIRSQCYRTAECITEMLFHVGFTHLLATSRFSYKIALKLAVEFLTKHLKFFQVNSRDITILYMVVCAQRFLQKFNRFENNNNNIINSNTAEISASGEEINYGYFTAYRSSCT